MFLLEEITDLSIKVIDYFGKSIVVEGNVSYVATDSDGSIYSYEVKPQIRNNNWASYGDEFYVGQCTFQGNWEDSLVRVE